MPTIASRRRTIERGHGRSHLRAMPFLVPRRSASCPLTAVLCSSGESRFPAFCTVSSSQTTWSVTGSPATFSRSNHRGQSWPDVGCSRQTHEHAMRPTHRNPCSRQIMGSPHFPTDPNAGKNRDRAARYDEEVSRTEHRRGGYSTWGQVPAMSILDPPGLP